MASPDEGAVVAGATSATEDAYANAYEYYQQYAAQQPQQPVKHSLAHQILKNKQDFSTVAQDMLGPDAALTVGLIGVALGVGASLGLALQLSSVSSICTTAKAIGDTSLTALTTTEATTIATDATVTNPAYLKINTIISTINAYATPSC